MQSLSANFPLGVAKKIVSELSISDKKTLSLVSKGDYQVTNAFIKDQMIGFWGKKRVGNISSNNQARMLKYAYTCSEYYKSFNDVTKSKAFVRLFNIISLDIVQTYGVRGERNIKFKIGFNERGLPEKLTLTCKESYLLADVCHYLSKKFNTSLCLDDETATATLSCDVVERSCMVRLFNLVVYDFLSMSEYVDISHSFITSVLHNETEFGINCVDFDKEDKYDKAMGVEVEPSAAGGHTVILSMNHLHNSASAIRLISGKLHCQPDSIYTISSGSAWNREAKLALDLCHFEPHPLYLKYAEKACMGRTRLILRANITSGEALEKTLRVARDQLNQGVKPSASKCFVM